MTVRTDGLTVCLFLNSSVFFIHCMILVCLLSCLFISFRLPEDKSFVPVEGFIALPDSQLSPFPESNAWMSDDKNSFQRWPDNFLRLKISNLHVTKIIQNFRISKFLIPDVDIDKPIYSTFSSKAGHLSFLQYIKWISTLIFYFYCTCMYKFTQKWHILGYLTSQ